MNQRYLFFLILLMGRFYPEAQITKSVLVNIDSLGKIVINPDHTWRTISDDQESDSLFLSKQKCDSVLLRKYVSNQGAGDSYLTGIRNMRTVLKGVLYRGGGNNKFNTVCRRDNNNPISTQSLINMSSYGFKDVVYLYNKNFNYYYSENVLKYLNDLGIQYQSIVPGDDTLAYTLLSRVFDHINHPEKGPVYLHCWNGWHMSGLISAYALMQFCDFSNYEALIYWNKGTDGNNKGYTLVKNRISTFKKFPNLSITQNDKLRICPCLK